LFVSSLFASHSYDPSPFLSTREVRIFPDSASLKFLTHPSTFFPQRKFRSPNIGKSDCCLAFYIPTHGSVIAKVDPSLKLLFLSFLFCPRDGFPEPPYRPNRLLSPPRASLSLNKAPPPLSQWDVRAPFLCAGREDLFRWIPPPFSLCYFQFDPAAFTLVKQMSCHVF